MQIGSISLLNNAKLAKAVMKDEFLSFKRCVSSHIYTKTKAQHTLWASHDGGAISFYGSKTTTGRLAPCCASAC